MGDYSKSGGEGRGKGRGGRYSGGLEKIDTCIDDNGQYVMSTG